MALSRAASDRARRASARQDPELAAAIRASLVDSPKAPIVSPGTDHEAPSTEPEIDLEVPVHTSSKRRTSELDEMPNKAAKLDQDTNAAEIMHDGGDQGSQSLELTELDKTPEPPVMFPAAIASLSPLVGPNQSDPATALPHVAVTQVDVAPASSPTLMPPPKAPFRRQSGRAIKKPSRLSEESPTASAVEAAATLEAIKSEPHNCTETDAGKDRDGTPFASKRTPKSTLATRNQTAGEISKAGNRKRKFSADESSSEVARGTAVGDLSVDTDGDEKPDEAERPAFKPRMVRHVRRPTTQPETLAPETPAPVGQGAKRPARRRARASVAKGTAVTAAGPKDATHAGLPSPPLSQETLSPSNRSPLLDDATVDPLLKLSRFLTQREPLETKPLPQGQPGVWAPGRQELCETLPYFQAYNSGCYSNAGTMYALMQDGGCVNREHMDENLIIARMGGSMGNESGERKGGMSQLSDHKISDAQPQAFLNNLAHKNPIAIICGDKNTLSPTKMPHRYCVLDWFKPTHLWAEKPQSGKKVRTTIKYRLERLDRTKPAWYAATTDPESSQSKRILVEDATLSEHICGTCHEPSVQTFLVGWMCLKAECPQLWKLPDGEDAPYGELDYHPAFLTHRVAWEREDPPFSLNPGVPNIGSQLGENLLKASTRGAVCPKCGRCNMRYLFRGWRCDTKGCDWQLTPKVRVVSPENVAALWEP